MTAPASSSRTTDHPLAVRPARESDVHDVAALWLEAFPGNRSLEDRVRMLETGGRYGGLDTVLVARADRERDDARSDLAGACKIYRLDCHVAGVAMPTMGLAAVAVSPSHRRQGLGAHLCTHALRVAVARGDVLSALYPFRPDYYERLGWGLVGELLDHRFHTGALPAYPEANHVRIASDPADADAIAACYARVAARSNGPIRRDRRVWAYRLAGEELGVRPLDPDRSPWSAGTSRRLALLFDDDGVTGYALLRHDPAGARRPATLEVRELVAESERAYRGLLGHIAGQADRWPRGRHFARHEERFGDRLREPRPPGLPGARSLYFPVARVVRGPMLRVLDVPEALRLRTWFDAGAEPPGPDYAPGGAAEDAVFVISVDDGLLPDNRGPWTVRLRQEGGVGEESGGKGGSAGNAGKDGVAEGASGEGGVENRGRPYRALVDRSPVSAPDAALSTDPSTFARIFAGDISPGDAARLGWATLTGDARLLDRAFATRERFWLLDEF